MINIWEQIKRMRPFFNRRDKLRYLVLLCMMVVGALLDVIGIGAVPAFVATLAAPEQLQKIPVLNDLLSYFRLQPGKPLIIWGSVTLLAIFLLKNIYLSFMFHRQFRIIEDHRVKMSDRLFSAYMRAPYVFHLQRNSAELLRNAQMETAEVIKGVIIPMLDAILGGIMTVFTMALLIFTTPWVAIAGFGILAFSSALFYRLVRKRLNHYGIIAKEERMESVKALNQGLGALVDARVLGREENLIEAFRRSIASYAKVDRLNLFIGRISPYFLEMMAVGGLLAIILLLAMGTSDLNTLMPTLALYGAAVVRLRQTAAKIISGLSAAQFSIAAVPNVMDDLEALGAISSDLKPRFSRQDSSKTPFQKSIRLDKITFQYPSGDKPALKDISLEIRRGESVAFVGSTGSGKSTLVNLLLGMLKPQSGTVYMDGLDIHQNLRGWLDNVGYIPQTIFLLDDSIRHNIAFGLPDGEISDEKVWQAVRAAQLEAFVQSLPEGLDTVVGERGVRISGGQRQRIGLARALYHDPEVLVMDEATSSLDNNTENLVMQALEEMKQQRTLIMIAHRLTTVQNCDRLYFLNNGQVESVGTYDDLVKKNREFQKMAHTTL